MNRRTTSGAISLCRLAELPELVALVNAAYRGTEGHTGWTSEVGLVDGERVTLQALERDMTTIAGLSIYLLREPPELIACVRLEDEEGAQRGSACHISMLAVHPKWQDAGLGRQMLEFSEQKARARGARAARMSVVSIRAPLIAWYERRGYRRTGESEPFPYDDARFGQPQQGGLEFILLQKELE